MTTEVNIPGEASAAGWNELMAAREANAELQQAYARALHAAAPLIVAEARRHWETGQEERMAAEVHDIANARHIHVQRSVDRFVDRSYGNVSEQEITKRYQQGVDQWNDDHPALLALWGRYNALVEATKAGGSR